MRKFILVMTALAVCTSASFASFARVNGLGVPGWMIEEDDTLMWMNPARTSENTNIIWGELVNIGPASHWGGLSLGMDPADVAAFIARPYVGNLGGAAINQFPAVDIGFVMPGAPNLGLAGDFTAPIGKFDLAGSRALDNMLVGARLSMASNTREYSDSALTDPVAVGDFRNDESFTNSDMGVVLGMKTEDVGPLSVLDVALALNLLSAENTVEIDNRVTDVTSGNDVWRKTENSKFEMDNGMNMTLTGRGIIPLENATLIAYLEYESRDISAKFARRQNTTPEADNVFDVTYDLNTENTTTDITLGAAINRSITERALMIAGVSLNSVTNTLTDKVSNNSPTRSGTAVDRTTETKDLIVPLNLALEYTISNRIVSRLGLDREIINRRVVEVDQKLINWTGAAYENQGSFQSETTTDNVAATGAVTNLSFGLGIVPMQDLVIDAVINQQILFTGGWFTSGIAQQPAASITATLRY